MGWKASGAERGKSYQVYRDLEARHANLQAAYDALATEVERKNALIRHLSAELASQGQVFGAMAEALTLPEDVPPVPPTPTRTPKPEPAGKPGSGEHRIDRNVPLGEQLGTGPKKTGGQ